MFSLTQDWDLCQELIVHFSFPYCAALQPQTQQLPLYFAIMPIDKVATIYSNLKGRRYEYLVYNLTLKALVTTIDALGCF